jgi:anaerobic magnesium-protoporphyrin IX monomethyl ester cyclase
MNRKQIEVLLFNPAPRKGWQPHRRVELPLNLLSPATPLVHAGYRVKIIDQFADPRWRIELEDALLEKPICFGVSSMTGPQIIRALEASRLFRSRHPDVPIVWGGIHASLLPEQTLENPLVDIVVVGEGEATLLELVHALKTGVPLDQVQGIAYKENGRCRFNAARPFVDLDAQPPLAYELIHMDLYRRKIFGADHVSFNSSRGCAHRCAFCYDGVVHKRKWRTMQPETVLERLKRLISDYDIHGFNFTDDNLFVNMDHAYRVLDGIAKAGLNIRIGKLHVRVDAINKMDRDFLELLVAAGVERLTIGVESGNQRILDMIRKDLTPEEVLNASRKLIPYRMVPVYLFMMGLPTEEPQELRESILLARRLLDENPKATESFNIYMPYPGTALYELVLSYGLVPPKRLEEWAPLNYRYVHKQSPWMHRETKRLIEALDFPLMFIGKGHFYKKTNRIVSWLSRLYHPLAEYRITHMDPRLSIETKLVKSLGLFGRQD